MPDDNTQAQPAVTDSNAPIVVPTPAVPTENVTEAPMPEAQVAPTETVTTDVSATEVPAPVATEVPASTETTQVIQ